MQLSRRSVLGGLAAMALPVQISFATMPTTARLVLVNLRGAMDGLAAVPPYADKAYRQVRGALAEAEMNDLDGRFGLHPALKNIHNLYQTGEMAVFHAIASPYRERSHFDAQALVEGGGATPHGMRDGWLNRTLQLTSGTKALAVGQMTPFILSGPAEVATYAPSALPEPDEQFMALAAKALAMDMPLASAFETALSSPSSGVGGNNPQALAAVAGEMLSQPNGPRLAVMELGGWDTHIGQQGRLARALTELDNVIATLRQSLASVWKDTAIVVFTEFGRTAAPNGSGGTDHGTATAAFLLGGRVAGGQVVARWPGLASANLFQGRDLAPTADLRSLFKAVLAEHLGLSAQDVARFIFPASAAAPAFKSVLRA